ncbi:MAG: TusE/DsrC/DsvC family sulfur relay protein [Gammaproteobacteria bacterium]|nr:TusE/DsrC/DsvC family sulfur relay protein [Gammaproteobacteria bacterium]
MYSVDSGLLAEARTVFFGLDDDGFLVHPKNWTQQTAQQIADHVGVQELSSRHLQIVQFIRDYYFELGGYVTPRRVCSELDVDKAAMKQFFGSCINVWKIAGLPNPGEEARAYMS